jgi:hypothetical protein
MYSETELWRRADERAARCAQRYHSERARTQFASGFREGFVEGFRESTASAFVVCLRTRRIHVDDAAEQRILGCADVSILARWLERAAHATRIDDVLADG